MPVIEDSDAFGESWLRWWKWLQPEWRDVSVWPIPLDSSDHGNRDWESLKKGGHNAMYLVVVALSWWLVSVAHNNDNARSVIEAIQDMAFVLRSIHSQASSSASTAPSSNNTSEKTDEPKANTTTTRSRKRAGSGAQASSTKRRR